MQWTTDTPKKGDIIRVKIKFYYHYGIFVNENQIVQFGYPDNTGITPDKISVLTTDIQGFLLGGFLETAKLDRSELAKRRSPEETVEYALSKVGATGYHILHNNCEHFVNECVFSKGSTTILDVIRAQLNNKLKSKPPVERVV